MCIENGRRRNSWWKCRRRSTSSSRKPTLQFRLVVVLEEVFKVFPQNRVQQRLSRSRSVTFLSIVEAFVAFSQDRVQQRFRRRPLIFPFLVEVLTVFSPDRVPQRLPLRMLNFRLVEVFTVHAQDRVPAFSGPAPQRSRPGGGSVGGVEGYVAGKSTTARGRARHRRFAGRFFILPSAAGCGFIDCDAVAEFGDAAFGGFRVPVSWQGHFAARAVVTFSVRTGPDGFIEAYDTEATVRGAGLGIPSLLLGCHCWQSCSVSACCLRRTVLDSSGLCFRIVRFAWFDSGYSTCVSLRWLLVAISHTSV